MLRLNNKGYLTVEIILASVMTMVIAFFLIEITSKLVNKTDDYYIRTLFTSDKALITKNIRDNIKTDIKSKGKITNVNTSTCTFTFTDGTKKPMGITVDSTSKTITYGDYTKKINEDIKGDVTIKQCLLQNNYIIIQININDIFTDESRDINIVTYNG